MKLVLASLRLAVQARLSSVIGRELDAALIGRHASASETIDLMSAAAALLASLAPSAAEEIETTPLRLVTLAVNDSVVGLDPADAFMHPLLRDWSPSTLGGAVGQAMLGGAAFTGTAAGAPTFGSIALRDMAPGLTAVANLTFRTHVEAKVQLFYGPQPVPSAFTTIHEVSGDALCGIGMDAMKAPSASHGLAQDGLIAGAANAAYANALVDALAAETVH